MKAAARLSVLARRSTDPVMRAAALNVLGILRWSQGDAKRARPALVEALAISEATGYEVGESHACFFMALVDWMENDFRGLATNAQRALAFFTKHQDRLGMGMAMVVLAILARAQDDLATAERLLSQAKTHSIDVHYLWGEATSNYYLGEIKRAHASERRGALDPAAEPVEKEAAQLLYEGLTLYQAQSDSPGMAGCVSGLAGLSADHVRKTLGDEAFFKAAAVGYTMPLDQVIREARRALEPEGRMSGTVANPAFADFPKLLSPRERDVVEQLMHGRTDKQIADALFLSTRTISGYVADILRKTGVANRTALVVLLTRGTNDR